MEIEKYIEERIKHLRSLEKQNEDEITENSETVNDDHFRHVASLVKAKLIELLILQDELKKG